MNMFSLELQSPAIPKSSGAYILQMDLKHPQTLRVGRLGEFTFPAGDYLYVGSALGPGGLEARLGRHLRGNGHCHWHIDWLRQIVPVRGYFYLETTEPIECSWSQYLIEQPQAGIPVPGFGASDCRTKGKSCPAHLVWFKSGINVSRIRDHLPGIRESQVEYQEFTSNFQPEVGDLE